MTVVIMTIHTSRVPDQNDVSLLCVMLEIHHSGREPPIYVYSSQKSRLKPCFSKGSFHHEDLCSLPYVCALIVKYKTRGIWKYEKEQPPLPPLHERREQLQNGEDGGIKE